MCSIQQAETVNFFLWNPDIDTNIAAIQNGFELSSTARYKFYGPVYDDNTKLGSAPMAIAMLVDSTNFCVSFDVTTTEIDTEILNQSVICGCMLMNSDYEPLIEVGLGLWNIVEGVSIPPTSDLKTFFHKFDSTTNTYQSRNVQTGSATTIMLNFSISALTVSFDGHSIQIDESPKYISFHMRGKGINSFTIDNIVYDGFTDISEDDIINGTDLEAQYITIDSLGNKSSPIWKGKVNKNSCGTLCNINENCTNFSFDSVKNSCELFSTEDFVNVIQKSHSPIPVVTDINIKKQFISGTFLFYEIDDSLQKNIPSGIHDNIICMTLDNYIRNDFVLVDKYSRTYTGQFEYVPIPHPDTQKTVLSIGIKYGPRIEEEYSFFLFFNSDNTITYVDGITLLKTSTNVIKLVADPANKFDADTRFYNYEAVAISPRIGMPFPYGITPIPGYHYFDIGSSPRIPRSPSPSPSPIRLPSPIPDMIVIPRFARTYNYFDIINQCTNYTINGMSILYNNQLYKSPTLNKLILSQDPYIGFIQAYPGMYTLIEDTDIFGNNLKKGSFFTYQTNPIGLWE
jgi:hypothetical protein